MERIANAWRISQASWVVLAKDRELVLIPVLAATDLSGAFRSR